MWRLSDQGWHTPPPTVRRRVIAGSHRLAHKWFKDHPPPQNARGGELRLLLRDHPYIGDLHTEGDAEARIARFMDRAETVGDIPLQVVENTGAAGDVILLHPLVLHVAAPNAGTEPRFLLSGAVDTAAMYADSARLRMQAAA